MIETKLAEYRRQLVEEALASERSGVRSEGAKRETHEIAARKETQMEKMRLAMGFDGDIREGDAFNKEIQEMKKQKRIEERQQREQDRLDRERRREKERRARAKANAAGYFDKYEKAPERYDGEEELSGSDYSDQESLERSVSERHHSASGSGSPGSGSGSGSPRSSISAGDSERSHDSEDSKSSGSSDHAIPSRKRTRHDSPE